MPPKHYKTLTIRREVFKRLEEFAKSKGVSISDAIVLLLEYVDIYSKLAPERSVHLKRELPR